jgi:hypothetical protein
MSKETLVFVLGTLIFFGSFLGLPNEYKEWIFIISGIILMVVGYRLRRNAFLKSLDRKGERRGDAFVESHIITHTVQPSQKDAKQL